MIEHLAIIAVCTVAVIQDVSTNSHRTSEDPPDGEVYWRSARCCGTNCLFLLARAQGMAVQYEQVASLTHIGKNGSTLADLRLGASQLGLAAVVKKGNLQDLEASSLPVVAHLEDSSGNPERIGHFVLVMSINRSANTLTMFDGTSGTYSEVSVPEFFRQWSGYFLSTKPPYEWLPKAGIAILSLAILFAISQLRRKPAL